MKQLRDNLCAKPGGADCKYFRIQKGRYQLKLKKKKKKISNRMQELGIFHR